MLNLCLTQKSIAHNINEVQNYLNDYDTQLSLVTKVLNLTPRLIEDLQLPNVFIYDSKPKNLEVLRGKHLSLQVDAVNYSGSPHEKRIIVSSLHGLTGSIPTDSLVMNFDLGDGKEGITISEIDKLTSTLKERNVPSVAIMSNVGCLKTKKPTRKYFYQLACTVKLIEEAGIKVSRVSLGGSNCIPYLSSVRSGFNCKVELRIGEAAFVGEIPGVAHFNQLDLSSPVAFLQCSIRERGRAIFLADFGYTHILREDISSSSIQILTQSSSHSLLRIKDKLTNSTLLIPLNYRGLAKLSSNVEIEPADVVLL